MRAASRRSRGGCASPAASARPVQAGTGAEAGSPGHAAAAVAVVAAAAGAAARGQARAAEADPASASARGAGAAGTDDGRRWGRRLSRAAGRCLQHRRVCQSHCAPSLPPMARGQKSLARSMAGLCMAELNLLDFPGVPRALGRARSQSGAHGLRVPGSRALETGIFPTRMPGPPPRAPHTPVLLST